MTTRNVLAQLKADLIGKDFYRGVTLSYTWLANQMGHLALGFIPTIIAYVVITRITTWPHPPLTSAIITGSAWTLFEAYNFLGPLLINKHTSSRAVYIPGEKSYTFQPAWGNIAFDTFTDVCFFWFGSFLACLLLTLSWHIAIVPIIIAVILIYPTSYWYPTKIYLQQATYPSQFRLSQWNKQISEPDKEKVLSFLNSAINTPDQEKHLFVFGGKGSGKTALGIGLSTEASISHKACSYTTAMKLFNLFFQSNASIIQENGCLWTWRTASLLVIDDINPGDPMSQDIVTADQFYEVMMRRPENHPAIKEKHVIWILGNNGAFQDWHGMLLKLGVQEENIATITLG